jgi:peptidoglycan/xylan/chitin deacetylase (PgdA/CDA1 family)/glycerol-3-phosphate acyltransferase PlsY
MSSFVHIFIFSYCFGIIRIKGKDNYQALLLDFFKGLICVALSGLYVSTGLAFLVSTVGVVLGHKWPVSSRFAERDGEVVLLGVLLATSPIIALGCGLVFLIFKRVLKKHHLSVMVTGFVLVLSLLALGKPDSLVFAGIFIFLVSIVQFLSHPEEINQRLAGRWFYRKSTLLKILLVVAVLAAAVLMFFNRYVYKGFGMQMDLIRNGPREFKYVALTFDDGPDPVYTPQILDILEEKDVKATFFLVGNHAFRYPSIVERMYSEGHSIGNHTNSHRSLIPLSKAATYGEIMLAEEAIEAVTGEKPTLFRPPRGVYSQYARELLKERRYTIVLWDVSSQDWEETRHTDIVNNIMNRVQPGSVMLFHDSGNVISSSGGNRSNTVKALPIIIDGLIERGYSFLTIDEMIILKGLSETEDGLLENY